MCLSGEVAAAAFGEGGDDGDGRDEANSQSRGGCRDSLAVVVNTNCLWKSLVGGSRCRGNRPSHKEVLGTTRCIYHLYQSLKMTGNSMESTGRKTSILNYTERVAATSSSMKPDLAPSL